MIVTAANLSCSYVNRENQSDAIQGDLFKVAEVIHKETGIDTKPLVVGQIIRMKSGPYNRLTGKVVKVTPEGIEVEALKKPDILTPAGALLGFNRSGTEQTSG
jgi:hypothetical protein